MSILSKKNIMVWKCIIYSETFNKPGHTNGTKYFPFRFCYEALIPEVHPCTNILILLLYFTGYWNWALSIESCSKCTYELR